jgi:hypothetical protein
VTDFSIETRRPDGSITYGEVCPECHDRLWLILQEAQAEYEAQGALNMPRKT